MVYVYFLLAVFITEHSVCVHQCDIRKYRSTQIAILSWNCKFQKFKHNTIYKYHLNLRIIIPENIFSEKVKPILRLKSKNHFE